MLELTVTTTDALFMGDRHGDAGIERYPEEVQFRLTSLLSGIIVTMLLAGCASAELPGMDESPSAENVGTKASPIVGTWRWSGSGTRFGDIELGEEDFVFRDDGTYAVL